MTEPPTHDVKVECYAGYRGEESPRRFTVAGRKVEVVTIEAQWREPGSRVFRVRGDDGRVLSLRQSESSGEWELAPAPASPANGDSARS